jgi:hypothetical protein
MKAWMGRTCKGLVFADSEHVPRVKLVIIGYDWASFFNNNPNLE